MPQIADMTQLAPEIKAAIVLGEVRPSDRQLGDVLKHATWPEQRRAFDDGRTAATSSKERQHPHLNGTSHSL
tara:strand:+ start:627 stop:842 length:216 start_codon:yes stop_codon:yes gene_type:complete